VLPRRRRLVRGGAAHLRQLRCAGGVPGVGASYRPGAGVAAWDARRADPGGTAAACRRPAGGAATPRRPGRSADDRGRAAACRGRAYRRGDRATPRVEPTAGVPHPGDAADRRRAATLWGGARGQERGVNTATVARVARAMSENELLVGILDRARWFGVVTAHFRPARTKTGWVTAVAGDGKGFPDLVLVGPGGVLYR